MTNDINKRETETDAGISTHFQTFFLRDLLFHSKNGKKSMIQKEKKAKRRTKVNHNFFKIENGVLISNIRIFPDLLTSFQKSWLLTLLSILSTLSLSLSLLASLDIALSFLFVFPLCASLSFSNFFKSVDDDEFWDFSHFHLSLFCCPQTYPSLGDS